MGTGLRCTSYARILVVFGCLCVAQRAWGAPNQPIAEELNRAGKNCGTSALIPHEMRDCVVDEVIGRNDAMAYSFVVDNNGPPFSILITLRTLDGVASMTVTKPNREVLSDETVYTTSMNAVGESFIRLSRSDVMSGQYRIDIRGMSALRGSMPMYLRVQSFGDRTVLEKGERVALSKIIGQCCVGDTDGLCKMMSDALSSKDPRGDICQVSNNVCNRQGQLTKLSLGGGDMACPDFPKDFSKFAALETLDLSFNDFGGAPMDSIADVLSQATQLDRLMLRRTGTTGTVPCALVDQHPLKTLMMSFNPLEGELPPCVLMSETLEELYMSRTGLTGQLPDVIPPTSQLRLWYAINKLDQDEDLDISSEGFSGSLPTTVANAAELKFLEVSHHNLTGTLPQLPPQLTVFDVSNNQMTGSLPTDLPENLLMIDVANNQFTGRLPDLHTLIAVAIVDIGNNQFSGPLPMSFGASASTMTYFDARGMGIGGRLEETDWRPLGMLTYLTLRHNKLEGPVPASLGALPGLMVLDLYNNSLSGDLYAFADAIPTQLPAGANEPIGRKRSLLQAATSLRIPAAALLATQGAAQSGGEMEVPLPFSASSSSSMGSGSKVSALVHGDCLMHKRLVHVPLTQQETYLHMVQHKFPLADALLRLGKVGAEQEEAAQQKEGGWASYSRRRLQQDPAVPPVDPNQPPVDPNNPNPPIDPNDPNVPQPLGPNDPAQEPIPVDPVPEFKPEVAPQPVTDTPDINPTIPDPGVTDITGLPYVPDTNPNKLMYLDLSHNTLNGPIPETLENAIMFNDPANDPASMTKANNPPRMLDLSSNMLHGEVPLWLIINGPSVAQTCSCQTYFNISNNYLFCPTKASLQGFVLDASLNKTLEDMNFKCIRAEGNELVPLLEYLKDPTKYQESIPEEPEGGYTTAPSAVPGKVNPSSSGRSGKLNGGAIAGIVIGALAGVAVLAAGAFFLYKRHRGPRPMVGFKTNPTSYRKVLPPKPQVVMQPKPSAAPPVLGGGFGRGHEI